MSRDATTPKVSGSRGPEHAVPARAPEVDRRRPLFFSAAAAIVVAMAACSGRPESAAVDDSAYTAARHDLVSRCVQPAGVDDETVLQAMREVPRHLFVPERSRPLAYEDRPLPLDEGQTISQPSLVAFMTQAAGVRPGVKVLEIGTGSGYQAAVLAACGARVFSIEIDPALARRGEMNLAAAAVRGVSLRVGDGYRGWPEEAPFDAIIVTAAPEHVPEPLIEQLAERGKLVIPVGDRAQELQLIEKDDTGAITRSTLLPVRFVPMTGEAMQRER